MKTRSGIGSTAILATGLMSLWLVMMIGGTGPADRFLLGELYAADRPVLRSFALTATIFGNGQIVILISVAIAAWLLYAGHRRSALLLLGITLTGRLLVELQKIGISRLRPADLEHLAPVKSLSFPSAHAANSMILFLTIAAIVPKREHRRWAVIAALCGSFLVGISRPMLGVHYPSDVAGGWAFGAAWVLTMLAIAGRWPARAPSAVRR
jgi:membrane-associated phospholipid phosphatase